MLEESEAQLTAKIIRNLKKKGCYAVKIHGGPHQPRGLLDINCCYKGHYIGLEVKRPGKENTLTPIQKHNILKIRKAGGVAEMVTSVAQALEVLDDLS